MIKICEPAIKKLLQSVAADKVYHAMAPQSASAPYIVFQKIDSTRWRGVNGPFRIAQAYIQIDCYAAKSLDSAKLAAQVEEILDGYSGIVYHGADSPQEFVNIGGISLQNDAELLDQTEEPLLFRSFASYLVTYNQQ